MQAIMETAFDVVYLCTVMILGIVMIRKSRGNRQYLLFGVMAVTLGAGDAFHLVPRAVALCTTGLENYTAALGVGKLITSLTMTVFYVLLYYVWRERYHVRGHAGLTASVYGLAAVRIILCLFPQNQWLSADAPLSWAIYRNIPFALLGLLIIVLFFPHLLLKRRHLLAILLLCRCYSATKEQPEFQSGIQYPHNNCKKEKKEHQKSVTFTCLSSMQTLRTPMVPVVLLM